MSVNLIKNVPQNLIHDYPLSIGQKFYTDAGIYYEDIKADAQIYRCAVVPSKLISSTLPLENDIALKNNFAIVYNTNESPEEQYSIYYYDENGYPNLISAGGIPYHIHNINDVDGLQTALDDKISKTNTNPQNIAGPLGLGTGATEWQITNEGSDFKIQEVDGPTVNDIIIIYETSSGGNPDAKVKINGKLDAELDCGGW